MKNCLALSVILVACLPTAASAQKPLDSWSELPKLTHGLIYTLVTKDLQCFRGNVATLSPEELIFTLSDEGGKRTTFHKEAVLAFGWPRELFYDGRSSWLDASNASLEPHESLVVLTRNGKKHKVIGKYTFSESNFVFTEAGDQRSLPKNDIARIYRLAVMPLSEGRQYLLDELGPMVVFDSDAYRYWWHLEGHIAVLLYDADKKEDNRPIECLK